MALKDWKKIGNTKWRNKKNRERYVVVYKYGRFWLLETNEGDEEFPTKSQALRYASMYRRKN